MLENLKAKNSDINVFSAFSEEYKEFGRIITVSDNMLNEIIDTAEKISVPDSVIYTPEKKELENEVELLNDDDYVTRYARENYVFTRDGEQVVILPDIDQEK